MTGPHLRATVMAGLCVALAIPATAIAQAVVPPSTPAAPASAQGVPAARGAGSKWWVVAGGGFSMARAGCATCSRAGVFTNSKGLFFDVGGRVTPRVDFGVEAMFVRARIEDEDPILTTFILGVAQFRPLMHRGLYLRAGMGVGFAGNGLIGDIGPELAPPYSTNALGVTYGLGWVFKHERRRTLQAYFAHHIAAIGELSTVSGQTVKNVVGNYWTSGAAIVFR